MTLARFLPVVLVPALMVGCSGGTSRAVPQGTENPDVAASAPLPGVTLPPGGLRDQVLLPEEVPAGMVPILKGSGPRTASVVAGYSGTGATAAAAEARLTAHKFVSAYVGQYANLSTGQVISVLASQFADARSAAADFTDDIKTPQGKTVPHETIGEQSAVTIQDMPGTPKAQLVLVRFRRATMTWSLAYKANAPADATLPITLAGTLLGRTAT